MYEIRNDYCLWRRLLEQPHAGHDRPLHSPPTWLARPGYVVWFFHTNRFYSQVFDTQARDRVVTFSSGIHNATYLGTLREAYRLAQSSDEPCLVLHSIGHRMPVCVAA